MWRGSEKVRPEGAGRTFFASEDVSTMQTPSDQQQDLAGNKGFLFFLLPFLSHWPFFFLFFSVCAKKKIQKVARDQRGPRFQTNVKKKAFANN